MTKKRKDKSGRVLKTGENQRKNGTYDYRYTDHTGKVRCVYAKTLVELREKEARIQRNIMDGIKYADSNITVKELVAKYMNLKRSLSTNSQRAYSTIINKINQSAFGNFAIQRVKISDAKSFYIQLHDQGLKRNTISIYHCVLRPAFEMAVDDDLIRKNPFKFQLVDILPSDAEVRTALTKEQQQFYLQKVAEFQSGSYYNDVVLLLETGLRISELYGLTMRDIDLENRKIYITHQLCRTADKVYFVTTPKTKSGERTIPMSETAYITLCNVIQKRARPKIEMMVDGYSGFLFLDIEGKPKVAMHIQNYLRRVQKFIESTNPLFPKVTPHVLRHTFCTNMQQRGIDIKSLQYLMGHSSASVTLDVYSHTNYESVESAFLSAIQKSIG